MTQIKKAEIHVTGLRPLWINHFGPESIPLERQAKEGVAGNDPSEWKRSALMTENRQLYILPDYIFSSFREGARFAFGGRAGFAAKLAACLQVEDEQILFNRYVPNNIDEIINQKDKEVYLDVRAVKQPTTKGRNIRYRVAMSPGWQTQFTLSWDPTLITENQLQSIAIHAGQYVGWGDGRALGNGRYRLDEFNVFNVEEKSDAKATII